MKQIGLILLLVFAVSAFAAAQDTEIYVTTLYIEKVYASTLGYRIDYRRPSSLLLATSYLPLEWFGGPASTAQLVYADDNAVPFINIFYEDAAISHVVLYVKRNMSDLSWGSLAATDGLEGRFDVAEPEFAF